MGQTLTYTLSLNDKMSAKMSQIGFSANSTAKVFERLKQKTDDVNGLMKDAGSSIGALKRKIDLLQQEREWIPSSNLKVIRQYDKEIDKLNRKLSRLQNTTSRGIGGGFRNAINSIPFAGIITNPFVLAGAAGARAFSLGMEREMQETSFSVLLGGEDKAKAMIDNIVSYAAATPYKEGGLSQAVQTMLGFGVAQEKVLPSLKAIGDIAMGDANRMKSLSLAFAQSSAAGKLMGQDLNQMINAGFNPLGEMSKKTGKTIGELRKEMEKGNISFGMVEDAFKSATAEGGPFFGMADKMSKLFGGRLSTFIDKVNKKLIALYGALEPIASAMLDLAINGIDGITNAYNFLIQKFNEGNPVLYVALGVIGVLTTAFLVLKSVSMAQAMWAGILAVKTGALTAANWLLNASLMANPMFWIISLAVALGAVIAWLIFKIDGWGKAWDYTVKGMKYGFQAYIESNKWVFNTFIDGFMIGINAIMRKWYEFRNALGLGNELDNNAALKKINDDTERRKEEIKAGAKLVKDLAEKSFDSFDKAGDSLSWNDKSFKNISDSIKRKLGIEEPRLPGTDEDGKVGDPGGNNNGNSNNDKNSAAITGGTRNTTVNISLKNMVENLSIKGDDFKENSEQIKEELLDQFLRLLAMANTAAG